MPKYGDVNAHLIGVAMKEMVRRAIFAIRSQRFSFDVSGKRGYGGEMNDLLTSADKAAQEVYIKMIREEFPLFGVVAEEDGLRIPSSHPSRDIYFTVDPLDGTKAFVRRQSHGVGTMIALVCDGEVIAAYVGDVMTQEIYGYRPESARVCRISEFGIAERLSAHSPRPLKKKYVLLREYPEDYSPGAREFIKRFGGGEVMSGSIGTSMARLWKREVSGMVLAPGFQTPWDFCPVFGISNRLGFAFLSINGHDGLIDVLQPGVFMKSIGKTEHETIIVKTECARELLQSQPFRRQ
jgi:fructose-1,6-bisphosphatase/inositol monophosphatase family enzyme